MQNSSAILLVEHRRNSIIPEFDWLYVDPAGKKKALVFSPTLATVGVDKKVPERCKYVTSHPGGFEREKEKDRNFQPTKKQCTKLSASKGKQSTSLKRYCWKTFLKGYVP